MTAIPGFSFIPGGMYVRGDNLDGLSNAPVQVIEVSGFCMGKTEVSKAQWDAVRAWGLANGYPDVSAGAGVAADHPVQTVDWYDVAKWCNAASEMEGLEPVYYTDGAQTTVYRSGEVDVANAAVEVERERLPSADGGGGGEGGAQRAKFF